MAAIGSVFLGDVQRHRLLSTSTPPSSPPPHLPLPSFNNIPDLDEMPPQSKPDPPPPASIPPVLSLDLRLRWLETLLHGARQDGMDPKHELKNGVTLARRAEELQRRMDNVVQNNEGLRRFMDHYDQYAHLLTPAFALSGTVSNSPPTYENMTPSELEAFLAEMEQDIRSAERDMLEIETLEKKGVTGSGKLPEFEALKPRLDALIQAHEDDMHMAADLEKRIAALMDHHATHVDTLSELFVAWDDTIQEAENEVIRLERDRNERRRLGYE